MKAYRGKWKNIHLPVRQLGCDLMEAFRRDFPQRYH